MSGPAAAADRLRAAREALARAGMVLATELPWRGSAAGAATAARAALDGRHRALLADLDAVVAALNAAGRAGGTPVADAALAAALDAAGHPPPVPPATVPAGGGRGPDAEAVARWWAGLDPDARAVLERERATLVGGLDGLPAAVRDRANRAVLAGARQQAEQEERATAERLARARDPVELARTGRRLHEVRTRLARLTAVATAIDRPGRVLLDLEVGPGTTEGQGVRAAVARGDVDTAAHVGVYTPGFTTGVDELPARLGELDALAAAAGPGTAAVAWYGYDAPQVHEVLDADRSVLGRGAADEGGQRLASFLDGLDAARGPDAHVTAIGHSYGSVVTAAALAPGGADGVDDAVYLGSPGVGDAPGRPPGHAWVVEAAGDPVADTAWFGPDPNRMPGVTGLSAREVALPDGQVLDASRGHGDYLTPGSASAANVAAVIGGRPGDAVLDRGVDAGDRLRRLVGR
ncbi:alpha/beta hydrolase [Actinomycetospora cinnamomea]|uniref:Alpha/beta hydrolase family protein n=1 Tax=Actinomycetospora cinnamomea TaxID=663609 RepID=A0A2U1FF85_9PSEU|nr:alpha/beta hydrolase [Actinomycetospora cinnamomea]PVZ10817.1 alpha/beta hydrolase family protein [Actinomycetospora cinnamomea]